MLGDRTQAERDDLELLIKAVHSDHNVTQSLNELWSQRLHYHAEGTDPDRERKDPQSVADELFEQWAEHEFGPGVADQRITFDYDAYLIECGIHGVEFWHEGRMAGQFGERIAYCMECAKTEIDENMSAIRRWSIERVRLVATRIGPDGVAHGPPGESAQWYDTEPPEPNPVVRELPDGSVLRRVEVGDEYETRQHPSETRGREVDEEGRALGARVRVFSSGRTIPEAIEAGWKVRHTKGPRG